MEREILFDVGSDSVAFYCDARDTRSGFAHDTRMYVNGRERSVATCHYLNRTWESWRFQSVCNAAVSNRFDARKAELKEIFKSDHSISRICGARKDEFAIFFEADPEVKLLREIKKTLSEKSF